MKRYLAILLTLLLVLSMVGCVSEKGTSDKPAAPPDPPADFSEADTAAPAPGDDSPVAIGPELEVQNPGDEGVAILPVEPKPPLETASVPADGKPTGLQPVIDAVLEHVDASFVETFTSHIIDNENTAETIGVTLMPAQFDEGPR